MRGQAFLTFPSIELAHLALVCFSHEIVCVLFNSFNQDDFVFRFLFPLELLFRFFFCYNILAVFCVHGY